MVILKSTPISDESLQSLTSQLLAALERHATQSTDTMRLPMRDAAKRLRHSYSWLSRNWKILGLKPRRLGRVLFFHSDSIDAVIDRAGEQRRAHGRPKKIIGVLNAPR